MSSKRALRYSSAADMPPAMRALLERQAAPPAAAPAAGERRQRHVRHAAEQMNKTEARYAEHLDALKAAGDVVWWAFESIKIRLAQRTWLSIDFMVRFADGRVELHEVKGRKGERYHATEDGKLKVKLAAELYWFWAVRIVWPAQGGGWGQELQPAGRPR